MPVYVDALLPTIRTPNWRHDHSCHLFTDVGPLDELHKFAATMGLKRCWFQNKRGRMPHYDLTAGKRVLAVALGATELDRQDTARRITAWRESQKS